MSDVPCLEKSSDCCEFFVNGPYEDSDTNCEFSDTYGNFFEDPINRKDKTTDIYMFLHVLIDLDINIPIEYRVNPEKEDVVSISDFNEIFIRKLILFSNVRLDPLFNEWDLIDDNHCETIIAPMKCTMGEYFLFSICTAGIYVKNRIDYGTLERIVSSFKQNVRFSSLIGSRDIVNDKILSFRYSGLELRDEYIEFYRNSTFIFKFLRRLNKIYIDLPWIFGAEGVKKLKAQELSFFHKHKNGTYFYNCLPKRFNGTNSVRNYHMLAAVLSYYKFLLVS